MRLQARAAALQPPVLADRRLGQRAARPDGEQRPRPAASPPRSAPAPRASASGSRARRGRRSAGSCAARRSRARRGPRARRAPSSPASSSTCRRCPAPSKSRDASGPSSRIRSSTGSTRSACSRSARSCVPQWPPPSITCRKCGHCSIGSRDASCAQYSKTRPSRSRRGDDRVVGNAPTRDESVSRCARSTVEIESSCTAVRRRIAPSTSSSLGAPEPRARSPASRRRAAGLPRGSPPHEVPGTRSIGRTAKTTCVRRAIPES